MYTLYLITLLWAFSFSLIGVYLAGKVDPYIAVWLRMVLAFIVLLPFFRPSATNRIIKIKLMVIGALQIGAMYLLLYHSFLYISVAEVLLFTILTPLYVTLIDELIINRKAISAQWWFATVLSVIGAGIIRFDNLSSEFLIGFFLIQAANLVFAAGQVAYKRLRISTRQEQLGSYAMFFAGAALFSGIAAVLFADWSMLPSTALQWSILFWLGIVASGGGYLAWSMASKRVNIAQLATMNNMLIPAGILVNFIFWQSDTEWAPLLLGGSIIILSVWIASKYKS